MLNQEQLATALKAFGDAVPAGIKLHSLKVTPTVGYTDTQAKTVFVFALADSDEDVQRLSQVIERGIQAFEAEPGLSASLLRDQRQSNAASVPQVAEMTVTLDKNAVEALSHFRQALSAFQAVGHESDEGADLFLTSERAAEELGRLIADLAPTTTRK